jgi:hypothetical protein
VTTLKDKEYQKTLDRARPIIKQLASKGGKVRMVKHYPESPNSAVYKADLDRMSARQRRENAEHSAVQARLKNPHVPVKYGLFMG